MRDEYAEEIHDSDEDDKKPAAVVPVRPNYRMAHDMETDGDSESSSDSTVGVPWVIDANGDLI